METTIDIVEARRHLKAIRPEETVERYLRRTCPKLSGAMLVNETRRVSRAIQAARAEADATKGGG